MKEYIIQIFDQLWSKIEEAFPGNSGVCICKTDDVCAVLDGTGRMGCTKCGKIQK